MMVLAHQVKYRAAVLFRKFREFQMAEKDTDAPFSLVSCQKKTNVTGRFA